MDLTLTFHLSDPAIAAFGLVAGILALLSLVVSTAGVSRGVHTLRRVVLAQITTASGLAGLAACPPGGQDPIASVVYTAGAEPGMWALSVLRTGALAAAVCGITLFVLICSRAAQDKWTTSVVPAVPAITGAESLSKP